LFIIFSRKALDARIWNQLRKWHVASIQLRALIFCSLTWALTSWRFKKIGPNNFVQNIQDCSSNCPEQNRIKKIWGSLPSKCYISFHYSNVKLSRASLYTVGLTLRILKNFDLENLWTELSITCKLIKKSEKLECAWSAAEKRPLFILQRLSHFETSIINKYRN